VDTATYQDVTRVHTSALAAAEKRLLIRIATRLPAWVNSDHLTALGAVGMLLAGASYWLAGSHPVGLLLAVVCLAINWFGDSLDGTLARVRNCQRPRYGFYLDHVLDTVGALFVLAGLGLSGFMSPGVALTLLAAYYLLSVEIFLATAVMRTFRMSFSVFGPTELRIVLAIGTLALLDYRYTTIAGHRFLIFDVGGVVAVAGLLVIFTISALRNTRALYLAEPMPAPADRGASLRCTATNALASAPSAPGN
jgi:phosphatidylglycerophosphate synthase